MILYIPGEKDPIEELYDRYSDMLYRVALSMMKNQEDAEDVVQGVFEKYILQPHLFFTTEHEKAWFLRVTVNQCNDALRRRNLRQGGSLDDVAEAGACDHHSEVMDVLQKLPEEYRLPLVLHYFEELKIEEIASALQIGASAVKMRLKRGREMLKKELEEK